MPVTTRTVAIESDYADGQRYWNALCEGCREHHEFDSLDDAIEFEEQHVCPEEGDGDDD
jgi:hypothetical protein